MSNVKVHLPHSLTVLDIFSETHHDQIEPNSLTSIFGIAPESRTERVGFYFLTGLTKLS